MEINKNFKEMPLLLKILFIMSIFSLILDLISLIESKEIGYSYFGTGFPKNYPLLWYSYSISMGFFNLYVFLKRSYSLLVKYTILIVVIMFMSLFNNIYLTLSGENAQYSFIYLAIVYGIAYGFGALMVFYTVRQKKYFNKP